MPGARRESRRRLRPLCSVVIYVMADSFFPPELLAVAQRVIAENQALGRTVALAESCTGGLVAAVLTEIAGSSAVVDRAYVTYSNDAKRECLGVSRDIIDKFGAVSSACAEAMARGALRHSHADVAVAITGIAGPHGGTDLKPVGTVFFTKAVRDDVGALENERHLFDGPNRSAIRVRAALVALRMLLPDQATTPAPVGP